MLQDGFYEGELMNGQRGVVPSNFIEKIPGQVFGVNRLCWSCICGVSCSALQSNQVVG